SHGLTGLGKGAGAPATKVDAKFFKDGSLTGILCDHLPNTGLPIGVGSFTDLDLPDLWAVFQRFPTKIPPRMLKQLEIKRSGITVMIQYQMPAQRQVLEFFQQRITLQAFFNIGYI